MAMDVFAPYRRRFRNRFSFANDWLRLVLLGGLLIALNALILTAALTTTSIPGLFGSGSAMFGGAAIALFITKMARSELYIDWILNGAFYIGAGFSLYADGSLDHSSSLVLMCAFLLSSAVARIWIGLTASPHAAATWMLSSGWIAVVGVLWIFGAWGLHMPTASRLVLALDSVLQGVSIAGFGVALREMLWVQRQDR
jgi:uncharacterized membrane protein HdeD (DUF308 family)